jgi:hypothetical protein
MAIYPLLGDSFRQVLELLTISLPPASEIFDRKVSATLGLQVIRPDTFVANLL